MKSLKFIVVFICLSAFYSCTIDKTNFKQETSIDEEKNSFEEVVSINIDDYKVYIEALGGQFYKGYNKVKVKIEDKSSGEKLRFSEVNFLPILTNSDTILESCPHLYEMEYHSEDQSYHGYVIYTEVSHTEFDWRINIGFTINGNIYSGKEHIVVKEQPNKNLNMVSFTGHDDKEYLLALISPTRPKVAENNLIAGLFIKKLNSIDGDKTIDEADSSYSIVNHHKILLDPRMPEPSMGNHSSPNNEDLEQAIDGFYHGIVNYTMTGNWTLNFMVFNEKGDLLKGTEVSEDFTPGIEGEKSELYIDILF